MALLTEAHPELAASVRHVHDGRELAALTTGSATRVDATCPVCGVVRTVRVADLVRRPRCRACSPRASRRASAATGNAPATLRAWVLTRMADAGPARTTPCVECDRTGGRDAGLTSLGEHVESFSAVLDRPGCEHRPDRAWGMYLLHELVDRRDAERPAASSHFVTWRCRLCSHRWRDGIAHRTVDGRGCPRCTDVARRAVHDVRNRRALPFVLQRELLGIIVDAKGQPVDWRDAVYGDEPADPLPVPAGGTVVQVSPGELRTDDMRAARWRCATCGMEWGQAVADRHDAALGLSGDDESLGCPLAVWTKQMMREANAVRSLLGPDGRGNPHAGPASTRAVALTERAYPPGVTNLRQAREFVADMAAQMAQAATQRCSVAPVATNALAATTPTAVARATLTPVVAPNGRVIPEPWATDVRAMDALDIAARRPRVPA